MLREIVDWLMENIFTFNPITSITITDLFILYCEYFIIALIIAIPFISVSKQIEAKLPPASFFLVAVPLEDALFRYIPLALLGRQAAIYAHFIWALMHCRVASIIFAVIHGLLDLRLWLGGLWIEAIFIHLFHDILWVTIARSLEKNE